MPQPPSCRCHRLCPLPIVSHVGVAPCRLAASHRLPRSVLLLPLPRVTTPDGSCVTTRRVTTEGGVTTALSALAHGRPHYRLDLQKAHGLGRKTAQSLPGDRVKQGHALKDSRRAEHVW